MRLPSLLAAWALCAAAAPAAHSQPACEGGAYLNPQLFRGEAAHHSAVAEQEMHAFIAKTGLPSAPLYSIKRTDDVTASGRTPYCWIYSNTVVGLLSGYRPVVVNSELTQPAVLAITHVVEGSTPGQRAVLLKNLPKAEQQAILEKMQRSRCMGTAASVEAAIVKAEALCAYVEDVAAEKAVGQQGLIARAAFAWEDQSWTGVATREAAGLNATTKGLAGKTDKVHVAKLVVIPTRSTSFGFGLYVHPSVPEAAVKKAAAAFQGLSAPSKPLATALDIGAQYSFVVPSAEQIEAMKKALGLR